MGPKPFTAAVIAAVLLPAAAAAAAPDAARDESILHYLERTIAWHRDAATTESFLAGAREKLFVENIRENSLQMLRSAFQFARASAALPSAQPQGGDAPNADRSRSLIQAEAAADQRAAKLQSRIAALNRAIQGAPPWLRASLMARREKLEGDLGFATARRTALRSLIGLLNGPDTGLAGKIDDLEQSVPDLLAARKATGAPAAPASPAAGFRPESAGIVGLGTGLFHLTRGIARVNLLMDSADELRELNDGLRVPLRTALRQTIRRSEEIAAIPESADPAQLAAARKELDALLARFKLLSAVSAPLGQGRTALNATRASLAEWQGAMRAEYRSALRYLLLRAAMLAVVILAIFLLSEVWRRATVRYVQELRRRRQILLLRRIVVGCTVALLVALSFVTEFGSLATFAGFSAAGIAVAMQSVIVSVVAYFFLVGRWGVRVGDRLTVSGVTGDVIDIGLFRLYLMEVAGTGPDRQATGRVVVFPNAVFFQPAAMYKQLPGVDYTWCPISLALSSDLDPVLVESRLAAAVEPVYAEYREAVERQYRAAQSSLSLRADPPRAEARVRFAGGRVEFSARYPVETQRAAEFEDRATRALLGAIANEPRVRLAADASAT